MFLIRGTSFFTGNHMIISLYNVTFPNGCVELSEWSILPSACDWTPGLTLPRTAPQPSRVQGQG